MADDAEKVYLKSLCAADLEKKDRLGLNSDLADLYAEMGKYESAIERLTQIKIEDATFFPDIGERISRLASRLGDSSTSGASFFKLNVFSDSQQYPDVSVDPNSEVEVDQDQADPRRRAPRVKMSGSVEYSYDQINWANGYSTDISMSGIFVITHEPVPLGSLVFLKFKLPDLNGDCLMELIGQAVRQEKNLSESQGTLGMGINFISVDADQKKALQKYIKERRQAGDIFVPQSGTKIRFHCDNCGRILTTPESYSGKTGACACGATFPVPFGFHSPSKENPLRGYHIAGCRIDSVIGKGSAATVYKGHHQTLDIPVAIKILNPVQEKSGSQMAKGFLEEARVVARIKHANIVDVMNAGEEKGHRFIVMQYVSGKSLGATMRDGDNFSFNELLRIFLDVSNALSAAHEHSVVHRDIKPDNILLTKGGRALLGDFGLVKDLRALKNKGAKALAVGTPLYIAPEQAKGEHATDFRSDVYSLGATMYHALAGKPPFLGLTHLEVIHKHANEPLTPLTEVAKDIPQGLSNIVTRAMMKDPGERFQTAEELKQALLEVTADIAASQFKPLSKKLSRK
jgi:tRNA A-37 threonylcarbamoyl transferase component Bud32